MSSPRRSERSSSQSSVPTPRSTRQSDRGTPSSSIGTPSARRRLPGTSDRDVIPPSENDRTSRHSQAASSPFHGGGLSEIDLSSPINYGTPSSVGSMRSQRSGIRGTPKRQRFDIGSEKRLRTLSLDPNVPNEEGIRSQESELDTGPELVIWGTNVVVSKCKQKFKRFIEEYIDETPADDEVTDEIDRTSPLYLQKLQEVKILEEPFLNLNCGHLEAFDSELYHQLLQYPQEVIPTLDMAVNEMFFEKYPAAVLEHQIQVRPFNSRKTKSMRSLNPDDIDQLMTVNGMVIRTSNLIPEIREAFFVCVNCGFSTSVAIEKGNIAEPTLCTSCSTKHCFTLMHNRSQYTDKQIIKLQEAPDDIPAGQTPHTISLLCYNDMVDTVQSGTRVTVTGVFRAVPIQMNPRMSNIMSVYRTYIDVVHFRKLDVNRLHMMEDGKLHKFSADRIDLLRFISTRDDVYERLANAVAPSIFGNIDVKKGILLQLFGGTRKKKGEKGTGKLRRSELNILLCGDPGTSKSQLLSYVYNLVPRSQYTSGKGSSAVGLTAYVTKDPETRQLVLQTGALVLADNGICCIDEFDKMDDSTRSVLHEVMEQQSLSIAKAGIICQLNARTSILAAANPCESEWNRKKTIIENILLPHSLLSRFDLIFLMLDPGEESYDARLGHHLVSLYFMGKQRDEEDYMEMDILKDYLAFAKENIHPKLTEEASRELITSYVQMREIGNRRGQITAYPRQLESLIRMAEAHARMRLSDEVEVKDVKEAYRLYKEALKQSATDPTTGVIDVNILATGQSYSFQQEVKAMVAILKNLISQKDKKKDLNYQQLFMELKEAAQKAIEYNVFDKCLRALHEEHKIIYNISRGPIKLI